jgi:hypothetical protein
LNGSFRPKNIPEIVYPDAAASVKKGILRQNFDEIPGILGQCLGMDGNNSYLF